MEEILPKEDHRLISELLAEKDRLSDRNTQIKVEMHELKKELKRKLEELEFERQRNLFEIKNLSMKNIADKFLCSVKKIHYVRNRMQKRGWTANEAS